MQVISCAFLAFGLICSQGAAESPASGSDGGSHPPAGWKPSGHVLLLPARQQVAHLYGPPPPEFVAPQVAPDNEEEEEESDGGEPPITDDYPNTTPQVDESSDGLYFNTGFASQPIQQQPSVTSGVYHVLLPDGRLQRVEYTTAPLKQAADQRFTSSYQSQPQGNNQMTQQTFEQSKLPFQGSGQVSFQKPSFQSNQFALNAFKQNQNQHNNLGQSAAQRSTNGQYRNEEFGSRTSSSTQYYQQQKEQPMFSSSQPQPAPKAFTPDTSSGKGTNKTQVKNKVPTAPVTIQKNSDRFTDPQNQYPIYSYQPINFARQQEASDSPSTIVLNGYLASVQYPSLQPVPAPVYSYSSAPLVRILRKTD